MTAEALGAFDLVLAYPQWQGSGRGENLPRGAAAAAQVCGRFGPMETVQEMREQLVAEPPSEEGVRIQAGAYLLELSLDWIVLRASENIHHLLGESHVTLIEEPLGRFVQAQALHDLRNLFSRLSGTTGIARAYGVRLTDERDHQLHDIAFQLADGRVILEALPSANESFGQAFGSIGGLIAGLEESSGDALLDGGTRRMRALTGFDRVTLFLGDQRIESSRGAYSAPCFRGGQMIRPPVKR